MRSKPRRILDNINCYFESKFRAIHSQINARKRLKRMNGGFECDREYKEVVVPYWKKFGYKPAKYWYKIFSDRDKIVDPRYIPDDLYFGKLIPYFSNPLFRRYGEDKCYHDIWFSDLKRAKTLCKNIAGIYYDENMNIINKKTALEICFNYKDEFLIKPSIDSGEGRLIKFFDNKQSNISIGEIEKSFNDIENNFIVQAVVKQHDILSSLNESSLNTVRVVSFLFEDEVHILSSILRVGAKESKVDNVGAGGFACPILPTGKLKEKAVNRNAEWVYTSSDGVDFSKITVPSFDKIIEAVKIGQKRLAHFKIIGWDFAVDEFGDPVLIEFNSCPGSNQITCGPTFGDLTEKVLEEYFINKTLQNTQN